MKVTWELNEQDIKEVLMEHYQHFGAKIEDVRFLPYKTTEGYGQAEHEVLHVKAEVIENRKYKLGD